MLAMAEALMGQDDLLNWDDQSWAFPILVSDENGANMMGRDGGQVAKTPPLSEAKGKKRIGGEFEHDQHIWTERERRKKMRNMFNDLHALIPHLPPRADKSSIVDEAVVYIKHLQQSLSKLEKLKKEKLKAAAANPTSCDPQTMSAAKQKHPIIQSREAFMADQGGSGIQPSSGVALANPIPEEFPAVFKTWTSPNLVLNVAGKDAHINICCPRKAGLLSMVGIVMDTYKLEAVSVQVSGGASSRMCMIHARATAAAAADQFPEALVFVEEIFKQAANDIINWLNS